MNIPTKIELLPLRKINALSRDARKNYFVGMLKQILEENPSGINVTELCRGLNEQGRDVSFNRKTLLNYLSQLVGTREAYYETVGNTLVFKPNGRLLHGEKDCFYRNEDKSFYITRVENPNLKEKLVLIQEKELTPTGNKITGGIMLPETKIFEFMAALDTTMRKR